jgi:hypothetical protein
MMQYKEWRETGEIGKRRKTIIVCRKCDFLHKELKKINRTKAFSKDTRYKNQ